jgi:hypothetical protein
MMMTQQNKGKSIVCRTVLGCVAVLMFLSSLVACSSIDCPVENTVLSVYNLDEILKDTLTITSHRKDGSDTILLNQGINQSTFKLPMSFTQDIDVLFFKTKKLPVTDTVRIGKENIPHFESVDCGLTYFHNITSLNHTTYGIDSIVLLKSRVDYVSNSPHFLVYFKDRD